MKNKTELQHLFTTFLQQQNLEKKKLLLMVSGGVDSMVLLHVAQQVVASEQLTVLHINHNARDEAEEDANFVQNYCSKNNIKLHIASLPLLGGAGEGPNQEQKWRESRMKISQQVAKDIGAACVLTAHHATDLAETMIFRLTKGCGPSGLSPFDTSTKPFWQVPKTVLIDYAKQHLLEWREDVTNQDVRAERNRIRHEVLPALRHITPNLEKVFVREAQTFVQINDFLKVAVSSPCWGELEGGWLTESLKNKAVPLKDFLELPAILQKEFLRHIATQTPSQAELDNGLQWLLNNPAGKSQKQIGGTKLTIVQQSICWE